MGRLGAEQRCLALTVEGGVRVAQHEAGDGRDDGEGDSGGDEDSVETGDPVTACACRTDAPTSPSPAALLLLGALPWLRRRRGWRPH